MQAFLLICRALLFSVALAGLPMSAHAETPKIGIVVMHGKGGSPARHVNGVAAALEGKGMLVANIEMPWSGNRNYDVDTSKAEQEVLAALAGLKEKGARKLFVAGHSMGGAFALHFGGRQPVDGIIGISPGGNVGGSVMSEKFAASLQEARKLAAEGKGGEKARLQDYEGSRGSFQIAITPDNYISWFSPGGAMDTRRAASEIKAPVLWLVAARDYPGLRKANLPLFKGFAPHPMHRLVEPDADHKGAPDASVDAIVEWISMVAGQ